MYVCMYVCVYIYIYIYIYQITDFPLKNRFCVHRTSRFTCSMSHLSSKRHDKSIFNYLCAIHRKWDWEIDWEMDSEKETALLLCFDSDTEWSPYVSSGAKFVRLTTIFQSHLIFTNHERLGVSVLRHIPIFVWMITSYYSRDYNINICM